MQDLVNDRRVLLPLLLTAVVIAVGAALIVLFADDASSGGSAPSASSQPASGAGAKVDIADFKFKPVTVTIKAGAKVSWINHDSAEHTATVSGQSALDTGNLQKGDEKSLTFAKAGTYAYICGFHPFMKGTVVVR